MRTFKFFSLLIIGLLIITAIPFLFVTFQDEIFNENYRIESFKVPDLFLRDSLDGQEASKRLLQEMQTMISISGIEPKHKYIDSIQKESKFLGLNPNPIIHFLKRIFGKEDKIISAEIKKQDLKFEIILQVSNLNKSIPNIKIESQDPNQSHILDELIEEIAIQLLETIEPFTLVNYYLNNGLLDRLEIFIGKLIHTNSVEEKSFGFFIRGYLFLIKTEYKKAIEQFEKAIEVNPNYANAYYNWGLALYELDDNVGAIEKYKKAIEINPDDTFTYNNWGLALSEIGDHKSAIEYYKKAIKLEPNRFDIYDNLGWSLYELGNYSDAILNFKKATEINSDYANAYLNWGNALEALGNEKAAIEKYQVTIQKYETQLIKEPTFYFHYISIAEANAFLKNKEGFYKNFEIGLKNGIKLTKNRITEKPYNYYSQEELFQNLMKKYSGLEK